jgi:hypothetical protein
MKHIDEDHQKITQLEAENKRLQENKGGGMSDFDIWKAGDMPEKTSDDVLNIVESKLDELIEKLRKDYDNLKHIDHGQAKLISIFIRETKKIKGML